MKITCDQDFTSDPAVCLANHRQAERAAIMDAKTGRPAKYRPCEKCPTALEMKKEKEPMEATSSAKTENRTYKLAICAGCNEEKMVLKLRGICQGCLRKAIVASPSDPKKPAPKVREEAQAVVVNFLLPLLERDSNLMEYLRAGMDREYRPSLEHQILWTLKKAREAGL